MSHVIIPTGFEKFVLHSHHGCDYIGFMELYFFNVTFNPMFLERTGFAPDDSKEYDVYIDLANLVVQIDYDNEVVEIFSINDMKFSLYKERKNE